MTEGNKKLIEIARKNVSPIILSRSDMDAATVGYAILANNGKIYEGICIHLSCGLGFCAEAAAIANMIKDGETLIKLIVAVSIDSVLTPCGRCREMMVQVNNNNFQCDVVLSDSHSIKLNELLPMHWMNMKI